MKTKEIVLTWFRKWEQGDFINLPLSTGFEHTSPFGTIRGKATYIDLVEKNRDKFLGQSFLLHDSFFGDEKACVRYTATQGEDYNLEVSEWYYFKEELIDKVIAYYHIGGIREERKLRQ
ncbi:nuclear transport factor 2 family protein [Muriicola soli]|uniref:Nuclear transport factor 2 family protein n=1 Tax=Muriicola soli TaxID=2507538 RepID=A0A411E8I7_9FLAO|nr:nuclear transport factor 2 family protein [Muriicola soli]QBA64031.1 nuclear transport factor 2 family protein [Muriicola soli]